MGAVRVDSAVAEWGRERRVRGMEPNKTSAEVTEQVEQAVGPSTETAVGIPPESHEPSPAPETR